MSRPDPDNLAEQFRSVVDERGEQACPWIEPGEQGENLNVEDFPSFLIWRVANSIKTNVTGRYLEQFEMTLPEWRVLGLVARHSPAPFGELVARSSMDKGQLSRTLRLIAKRGLVRTSAIPLDRRGRRSRSAARMEVRITTKGAALCQRIVPVARATQMMLLAEMEPEERRVVLRVLRRLLQRLPEFEPPAATPESL
ncbi:MAG: MarR family winged helix-turn-helix transcriptional regulator [Steroidobacteraceae bacterium]